MTSDGQGQYTRVETELAADIRGRLQQARRQCRQERRGHEQAQENKHDTAEASRTRWQDIPQCQTGHPQYDQGAAAS